LALPSITRSWLCVQRLGRDVLRLRDGSLRGVLECAAPTASFVQTLAAVSAAHHPIQVVVQARHAHRIGRADRVTLLRASHAGLLASLHGRPDPLVDRLFVVVPWDVEEGPGGDAVLDMRVREVAEPLRRARLEPVRLADAELDALVGWPTPVERRCEVRVGDRLARTLVVRSHPERLDRAWFDSLRVEHDLALHLTGTGAKLREASAYLTLWEEERDGLDRATERAEEVLAAHGVPACRPHLQAEPALVSGLPLCLDLAATRQPLQFQGRGSLGASDRAQRPQRRALLYGVVPAWRQPVELDRFALKNPNLVLFGDAGHSRWSLVQHELLRARLAGVEVHLVDPRGKHSATAAAVGGTVVAPARDGRPPFDPFMPTDAEDALSGRIEALAALLDVLCGGLPPAVRPLVDDALAFTYAAHGFANEGGDIDRTPPSLGDVAATLRRRSAPDALVERLECYITGDRRYLLQRPAVGLAERAPVTEYSLAGLPEEHRPAATLLSLDQAWNRLRGDRPALVVVDGIDALLGHEVALRFVARLMERAPERHAGLTLVARDVTGVLASPLRDGVAGAGAKVLLRQTPEHAALLGEAFGLTPAERSWLASPELDEGLLLAEGERRAFATTASPEEARLMAEGGPR
jgi:hypothetical protein